MLHSREKLPSPIFEPILRHCGDCSLGCRGAKPATRAHQDVQQLYCS